MSDSEQDTAKTKGSHCFGCNKKIAALFIAGALFVVTGAVCYPFIDRLIQKKINKELVLKPDSNTWKEWQDPSVPIYLQFFMFDVVNPIEAKQGKPPYLAQKGPYSYREKRPKQNITWDERNSAVSYNQLSWYVFDEETSCDTCNPLNDYVTTVNIPLVALAETARNLPWLVRDALGLLFKGFKENLFVERRVHDLLWGYRDPMLVKYNQFRQESKFLQSHLPKVNPMIALQHNNSYDGYTTVHTGAQNIDLLVRWIKWKGMRKLKVWNTTFANMINGTDGSQFAPATQTSDTLYVFVTQLCRSLFLTFESKTEVQGIAALKFSVPSKAFQNSSMNPNNRGFCTKTCYPSGILDVGVCQPPSPITIPLFASAPHFYLGDSSLLQAVEGLSPNKEEHGTFLSIEPHTGISIKSSKRLQVNVKVEAVDSIPETTGINKMFLPILYINETATIDNDSANKLKSEVLSKLTIVHGVELGLVVLGTLLIVIAVALVIVRMRKDRKLKKARRMLNINEVSERSPLLSP